MKRLNKKGFTLVELLAVIVILAVVMLIAVTAVGPLMTRSRKSALGTEGVSAVSAAKAAYQAEQLNASSAIKPTSSVCFDLQWLCNHNYFEKGCKGASAGDNYSGSVLATYSNGKVTYNFWISNGIYVFGNATAGVDPNNYDVESATDGTSANASCGKTVATGNKISGLVYCSNAGNGCL